MKGLATLIKLNKRELDELRRRLVSLENQKSQLETSIERMQQELEREMKLAAENPDLGRFFGDFSTRNRNRQDDLRKEITSVDKRINRQREAIAKAFSELKKYEIALENAKKLEREQQLRKENHQLDEIASRQHERKNT